jgi:Family of unknown function (DUF6364)
VKPIRIQKNKSHNPIVSKLTTATGNTISAFMKKVTITLTDEVVRRACREAAKQGRSLSRFVADLLEERFKTRQIDKVALLREFFDGRGYAGVSKAWRGREALYAEREDELLRRYRSSHSQVK